MKSHITLEQQQCPVCLEIHETGSILLHNKLKPVFDTYTVTGMSLCPDDQQKFDDGYIALIECIGEHKSNIKLEEANRTGKIIHIRREMFKNIFNTDVSSEIPFCFITEGVANILENLLNENS